MICRPLFPSAAALLCGFFLFPDISSACINDAGLETDGNPSQSALIERLPELEAAQPSDKLKALRSSPLSPRADTSFKKERLAIEAILEGKSGEAIPMLLEIEKKNPGRYSVAANLGTAYELAGDNPNALKWISEGIKRNPKSHYGTEWLHKRILEMKILLADNPDLLKSQRIIPLQEKFDFAVPVSVGDKRYLPNHIQHALEYQLSERMVFVKPKDPVVADLLFTYARLVAQTGAAQEAVKALEASQKYGFADPALLASTMEACKLLANSKKPSGTPQYRAQ